MPRLCTPSPTTSRKIDYWLDGGVGTEMSYRTASTPDRLIAAVVGQSIAEQGVGNGSFARAYVICAVFLPPSPSPPSLPSPPFGQPAVLSSSLSLLSLPLGRYRRQLQSLLSWLPGRRRGRPACSISRLPRRKSRLRRIMCWSRTIVVGLLHLRDQRSRSGRVGKGGRVPEGGIRDLGRGRVALVGNAFIMFYHSLFGLFKFTRYIFNFTSVSPNLSSMEKL